MNRSVLAVGLVGFCAFLGLYATQPLLPMLEQTFGASKLAVSLTISLATLGVGLAAPWIGVLAELRGRKKVIVPAVRARASIGGWDVCDHLLFWWFCRFHGAESDVGTGGMARMCRTGARRSLLRSTRNPCVVASA